MSSFGLLKYRASGPWPRLLVVALLFALSACGSSRLPEGGGVYKLGSPYKVDGKWYRPYYDPDYDEVGVASWYGDAFHGRQTANGEIFDKDRISAAHPTLPLPSLVRVTNLQNRRSLVLRVNDRGPFVDNRIIDLSEAAADELGFRRRGLARVRVQFVQLADARGTPPTPTAVARAGRHSPAMREAAGSRHTEAPKALAVAKQPAPVRTAARPAPEEFCPGGSMFVQVAALSEPARVQHALGTLARSYPVRVLPVYAQGTALAKVQVGPLQGHEQAQHALQRVRAMGYPAAFLVPDAHGTGTTSPQIC